MKKACIQFKRCIAPLKFNILCTGTSMSLCNGYSIGIFKRRQRCFDLSALAYVMSISTYENRFSKPSLKRHGTAIIGKKPCTVESKSAYTATMSTYTALLTENRRPQCTCSALGQSHCSVRVSSNRKDGVNGCTC